MKQYKESSHFSFCFFIFIFFFILAGAMKESVLERLRKEVRGKEVERKVEVFKKEQIEKKRAKQN